jgi:hypothetical protein
VIFGTQLSALGSSILVLDRNRWMVLDHDRAQKVVPDHDSVWSLVPDRNSVWPLVPDHNSVCWYQITTDVILVPDVDNNSLGARVLDG